MDNTGWRKSKASMASGQCVEVQVTSDGTRVRDSKNPAGAVLSFTRAEWEAFLDGARGGEFDPA
jgi:uncharacterized protein DUF397